MDSTHGEAEEIVANQIPEPSQIPQIGMRRPMKIRRRRQQKPVIDRDKMIPVAKYKDQLINTSDTLRQFDPAPRSKRAMYLTAYESVGKLFSSPGRNIPSPLISTFFYRCLTLKTELQPEVEIDKNGFLYLPPLDPELRCTNKVPIYSEESVIDMDKPSTVTKHADSFDRLVHGMCKHRNSKAAGLTQKRRKSLQIAQSLLATHSASCPPPRVNDILLPEVSEQLKIEVDPADITQDNTTIEFKIEIDSVCIPDVSKPVEPQIEVDHCDMSHDEPQRVFEPAPLTAASEVHDPPMASDVEFPEPRAFQQHCPSQMVVEQKQSVTGDPNCTTIQKYEFSISEENDHDTYDSKNVLPMCQEAKVEQLAPALDMAEMHEGENESLSEQELVQDNSEQFFAEEILPDVPNDDPYSTSEQMLPSDLHHRSPAEQYNPTEMMTREHPENFLTEILSLSPGQSHQPLSEDYYDCIQEPLSHEEILSTDGESLSTEEYYEVNQPLLHHGLTKEAFATDLNFSPKQEDSSQHFVNGKTETVLMGHHDNEDDSVTIYDVPVTSDSLPRGSVLYYAAATGRDVTLLGNTPGPSRPSSGPPGQFYVYIP